MEDRNQEDLSELFGKFFDAEQVKSRLKLESQLPVAQ